MACSSCKNLNQKMESKGEVSGAKYFCKVKCKYVRGSDENCSSWQEDILREDYKCDQIFEAGELYVNDTKFVKTFHDSCCSSCKYLNSEKESKGSVSGAKYVCSKKGLVYGNSNACIDYEKDLLRDNDRCDEIYEAGEKYYDNDRSESYYVIILIIIVIIMIIALITGKGLYF